MPRDGVHQRPGLLRRQPGQVQPGDVAAGQLLPDLGQGAGRLGPGPPGDERPPGGARGRRSRRGGASTLRVAVSAQCRSSRTSRTGRRRPGGDLVRQASPRRGTPRRSALSPLPDGAPASSSSTRASSAAVVAASSRRAWLQGHRVGAPSSCEHLPVATRKPALARRGQTSATSRDLPMPGSPTRRARRRRARLGAREHVQQRGLLGLAADRRPRRLVPDPLGAARDSRWRLPAARGRGRVRAGPQPLVQARGPGRARPARGRAAPAPGRGRARRPGRTGSGAAPRAPRPGDRSGSGPGRAAPRRAPGAGTAPSPARWRPRRLRGHPGRAGPGRGPPRRCSRSWSSDVRSRTTSGSSGRSA